MKKLAMLFTLFFLISFSIAENEIIYNGLSNGNSVISKVSFSDVKSRPATHWSNEAIYKMASIGLISGFENGTFAPSSPVTYEQAITLVIKALGKENEVNKSTNLTANGLWSDKYIRYAMKNGIVTEKIVMSKSDINSATDVEELKNSGVLIRDVAISREDVAKLVSKALGLTETAEITFADNDQISEDTLQYVKNVVASKIMSGDDVNMFNPQSSLTREEMAQVLTNAEDMILAKLYFTRKSVIVDAKDANSIRGIDTEGNDIVINILNKNIPVLKNGVLSGVSLVSSNDELECYINKNKEICFIKIIEDSVYQQDVTEKLNNTIQGTVVGNSPYFEQITIRNSKNEKIEYTYGSWTDFYRDGAKVTSFDIEQGDTVYIEIDEIDDVVSIRAVSNNTIVFATVTGINKSQITVKLDDTKEYKSYNLQNIYIYKDGQEIRYTDLVKGNYLKLYESETALSKVEVLPDKNTVENIYRGTVSAINLLQDTITLKGVNTYANGKWSVEKISFVTIDLDKDVKVTYYGEEIELDKLGDLQVGKEAYVVTRADSKTLEKARVIKIDTARTSIDIKDNIYEVYGNELVLEEYYKDIIINDATIIIENDKVIEKSDLSDNSRVYINAQRIDGDYIASIIEIMPYEEEEQELAIYVGSIQDIEDGEYVTLKVTGKYVDNEWTSVKKKSANFYIVEESRIISRSGPVNISEFSLDNETTDYNNQIVCVYSKGEEIVELSVIDLGETPLILKGNIKRISGKDITIENVDYYDYEEDDWIYDNNYILTYAPETIIIKNGAIAKENKLEVGKEITILKVNDEKDKVCGVIIIKD
ncbi:MAG: S-layer homology domain-containing protein [Clostridiales bacterium]|nr:S-layer homology domain-containing protein [Clostridiales bacterium]